MTQRGKIGEILMTMGRIGEEDVEKALAYQREHGGYFGEALVTCGLVSEKELEWTLASQFDLPYVFPEADSIDHEAAALVSPEWALANLTLPIMKTSDSLTVIVESPLKAEAVEELRTFTELEIELALASPSKIRELIREVYARASAADESESRAPAELTEALDIALQAGAPRFGISVRGRRAWAWWDEGGTIRRRPVAGDWERALELALEPGPGRSAGGESRAEWHAALDRAGVVTPVEVRYMSDESGREFLFHPGPTETAVPTRFPPPNDGVLSEVRLLARSGKARFIVTADPPALGHRMLPHLPEVLLDPSWRSLYINTEDRPAAEETFSQRLADDPETWATELAALRAFHFDVVTVDLTGHEADWTGPALDVASVAFLLWAEHGDFGPAYEAGIRWRLHVTEQGEEELEWSLEPLHA